jgi:hypothetical protein
MRSQKSRRIKEDTRQLGSLFFVKMVVDSSLSARFFSPALPCSTSRPALFPSEHAQSPASLKGMPLRFATMTGGARIRDVEPGRKAGTDRRTTVGTTVTERIPEGRAVPFTHARKFHPAKRSRTALGGQASETQGIPYYFVNSLTRWPSSGRMSFSIASRTAFSEPGVEKSTRPLIIPAVARLMMAGEPIS